MVRMIALSYIVLNHPNFIKDIKGAISTMPILFLILFVVGSTGMITYIFPNSLPFAIFQFGHEIRVARLHFFYGLLRLLNLDIEEKVQANGIFQFDQFIYWLEQRADTARRRYLFTDEEVIADGLRRYPDRIPSSLEIAVRYTYPLKYVEEVLLPEFELAQAACQSH